MKRFAILTMMIAAFAISVSIAMATTSYSPWLVSIPSSSWGSQVVLFNTSATQQTANFTFHKVDVTSTETVGSIAIPGRSSEVLNWTSSYPGDYSGFIVGTTPGMPLDGKFATFRLDNTDAYFLGFTFRFKLNYSVIYSEPLFAWPMYSAADGAGTPQYTP